MALPPILVELKANSREFVAGMKEAQHEVQKLGTGSAAHMQKFAAVGKAALFGVGAVALTVGGFSLEMADQFEEARTRLEGAVHNVHGNFEALKGQVGALDGKMRQLGFSTAETEGSLAGLTVATKNPAKAMRDMSLAADLARGRHISLAEASNILVKVETGHVSLLGRLGIATKDATGHTISQHEAIRRLSQLYGGDAARYSETFTGKVSTLKAQMEDLSVKIGLALIPILEKLGSIIEGVVGWFEKHAEVAKILGVAIGTVLVVAIAAYTVAMVAAAVATIAATWPILAIIAAVAAVGVGIYELATHWHQVWGAISSFMSHVGHEILHVLETWGPLALAVLMPFLGIPLLIATHWRELVRFVEKVWRDTLHAIESVAGDIVTFVERIPKMILDALGDLDHLLVDAGKRVIHGFVHGIEGAAGDVKGALGSMTHKLTSWKGPPEKDRHILYPAGQLVIQGFVDGIESMTAKVQDALGRFTVHAHDLMFTGGKAVGDALVKGLESVDAKLKTKLDGIVAQLASVKSAAAQMASGITSSLSGAAGLSSNPDRMVDQAVMNADGTPKVDSSGVAVTKQVNIGPDTSVGGVTSYLQSSLTALQQFQGDLSTLAGKGLSADQLQQIAQQGVTKGDQYAQSFLGASADQIAQLNQLDAGVLRVSTGIGSLVSAATFGTQMSALTAQEKQTTGEMTAIKQVIAELLAETKNRKKEEIHVHLQGPVYGDAADFARALRTELIKIGKQTGNKTLLGMA